MTIAVQSKEGRLVLGIGVLLMPHAASWSAWPGFYTGQEQRLLGISRQPRKL